MTTLRQPTNKEPPPSTEAAPRQNVLTRIALRLTSWMEKWFPDSFVFVLLAVVVTAGGALCLGANPLKIASSFGDGFWDLITFTMQASLMVIGGYVVASSPLAARAIRKLAAMPASGAGAVAFIATVSCVSSLVNWAFSLVFSALPVREIARRRPDLDYRAASAAAILGLGSVWALGLSSAPAQLEANAARLPPALLRITGVTPFSETIFQWQSIVMLLVLLTVSTTVAYLSTPRGPNALTAQALGIDLTERDTYDAPPQRPVEWLECSRLLPAIIIGMAAVHLAIAFAQKGVLQAISNLNTYNLLFLALGLLLHGTPRRYLVRSKTVVCPSVCRSSAAVWTIGSCCAHVMLTSMRVRGRRSRHGDEYDWRIGGPRSQRALSRSAPASRRTRAATASGLMFQVVFAAR